MHTKLLLAGLLAVPVAALGSPALHDFETVAISPDGRHVAAIETLDDGSDSDMPASLMIRDMKGGAVAVPLPCTAGPDCKVDSPAWSTDGRLAFLVSRPQEGAAEIDTVDAEGHAVRRRYLIGADGQASLVRRWAGLEAGSLRSQRLGFRRHYRLQPHQSPPWSSQVEVHWGNLGQAYVTPVAEDEICVAAITRHTGVHFDGILDDIPYLKHALQGAESIGRDRGAVTTISAVPLDDKAATLAATF